MIHRAQAPCPTSLSGSGTRRTHHCHVRVPAWEGPAGSSAQSSSAATRATRRAMCRHPGRGSTVWPAGTVTAYGNLCFSRKARKAHSRQQTSSAATHTRPSGKLGRIRPIICPACLGLVAKPTWPGTCAARQRSRSPVHSFGRYSSRSMSACPAMVAHAAITPTWQGKTPPREPVNWRATPADARAVFGGPRAALLCEPRPVHHQPPRATRAQAGAVVVQALDHVAAHDIAQFVHVPASPVQQVLLTVRARVAGMLSDLPAVLARQRPEQATHARGRPAPQIRPREDPPHLHQEVFQLISPLIRPLLAGDHQRDIQYLRLHAGAATRHQRYRTTAAPPIYN